MTNIKIIQRNSVPDWLLNHLHDVFPDKLPRDIETSVDQLAYLQGQQNVIDYLESLNDEASED